MNWWTRYHDLSFQNVEFKPAFSPSSFTFKRFFRSPLLSAIKLASSAYLRLLLFLLEILIPSCASSSQAFCMVYSAYKLNKQSDNIQPWCTPFLIWNQSVCSVSNYIYCFLTCIQASQEAGKMVWYSHCFKNFPQFVVIHTVKDCSTVHEAEMDVFCFLFFLELSCFFYDLMDIANLIPGSSAFSKSSLNIWNFSFSILLKPGLKNFEHYFANMWDECNCVVVWTFFGIYLSLGLEWKLTFSSPVATAEFSKFAGIFNAIL